MLSTFDYAVLVALYMLVSLQGGQLLKRIKFKRGNSTNALLLGLLFIGLLYVVNVFSRQVASYNRIQLKPLSQLVSESAISAARKAERETNQAAVAALEESRKEDSGKTDEEIEEEAKEVARKYHNF